MSWSTENILTNYFKILGLSCSAQQRTRQRRLSFYLALVLGDLLLHVGQFLIHGWQTGDPEQHNRSQFSAFVKITKVMDFLYLLTHILMVLQALIWRNRERVLLAQLPVLAQNSRLINLRRLLIFEFFINSCALILAFIHAAHSRQLLSHLRYIFSTQAVRARYLQMTMLVMRLDAQLEELQQQQRQRQQSTGEHLTLSASYAHLVRLARQLTRLYGLSVLLMNVLCIGDFNLMFYAYTVLWQLSNAYLSWALIWQAIYISLPALIKIWTLCAVCHNCAKRSQQLLNLIQRPVRSLQVSIDTENVSSDEFALQVMQNPVQFDVCGIYQLNLETLAGMFIFIVQSLVIILQFVELTKQLSS